MEQTGTYIRILRESLERKKDYLDKILDLTKEQEKLAKAVRLDEDAFEKIIEEKDIYIDNVNEIDKGFESVYKRVRTEIQENKSVFTSELKAIQELIRVCVDKGLEIEALEERNRSSLESAIARSFKGMNQVKQSKSVANKYYKSMANGMVNDSMLYDRKK
ncbi:MAG: hypothetical protein IKO61_09600 [Lachnospiraceae bacterium]|nr:hypothetical protein [Lachnospiraceae bacterium]